MNIRITILLLSFSFCFCLYARECDLDSLFRKHIVDIEYEIKKECDTCSIVLKGKNGDFMEMLDWISPLIIRRQAYTNTPIINNLEVGAISFWYCNNKNNLICEKVKKIILIFGRLRENFPLTNAEEQQKFSDEIFKELEQLKIE